MHRNEDVPEIKHGGIFGTTILQLKTFIDNWEMKVWIWPMKTSQRQGMSIKWEKGKITEEDL